ncbi:hypothetical protein Scep_016229 [Stephania cephalantha]|uniref:Uncharacterized protein n=1 Tax=Stephania cephalantha TaxID=152367 RepID=A0AAP0NVK7_9MAGN
MKKAVDGVVFDEELRIVGGKLAAMQLESRVALLAARKGLAGAASRYIGFRSMMMFLGPFVPDQDKPTGKSENVLREDPDDKQVKSVHRRPDIAFVDQRVYTNLGALSNSRGVHSATLYQSGDLAS